jgi:hypothetical protein
MSLTRVSSAMIIGAPVTPQEFGAVGDGVTNDTVALQAMFATNKPWYIPYTSGGYLVNDILAPKASGSCDGFLLADTAYANLVVNITGLGYQPNTKITGLDVRCKTARTTNSVGIRVASPSIVLDRCKATAFDYGIQVWSYSVSLLNCNAVSCKTNLSAYAPSSTSEINDFEVIGGSYDSATEYSCRIGDPRFSTTVPASELMGTTCTFLGAAFDAATSTFDRIYGLTIMNCYWENSTTGKAVELGGSGDGWMRDVKIQNCYFSGNINYSIYCNSPIKGLSVGQNYYGGNQKCFLYLGVSNLYGFDYISGVSTNSPLACEVHTGFTSVLLSAVTFEAMTISSEWLYNGVQNAASTTSASSWYPYGQTAQGANLISGTSGRFKSSPASAIAGTFSGTTFTCTTLADSYNFNGGDRITASSGGFTYVRSVNYDTGVLTVDGGSTASGAGTVSQVQASFNTIQLYQAAAPTTGTYRVGDIVYNSAPASAGYVGWVCTVAGTPGTWKTFGLIS